ncbi:MAG: hypothetical protein Q9174_005475, partial [Haloplaca sp. 1 TL-2023]
STSTDTDTGTDAANGISKQKFINLDHYSSKSMHYKRDLGEEELREMILGAEVEGEAEGGDQLGERDGTCQLLPRASSPRAFSIMLTRENPVSTPTESTSDLSKRYIFNLDAFPREEVPGKSIFGINDKRDQGPRKKLLNASESSQLFFIVRVCVWADDGMIVQEMMLRDPKCRVVWKECKECKEGSKLIVKCEGNGKRYMSTNVHDDISERGLDLGMADRLFPLIEGDEEPKSEAKVDDLIKRAALADPNPQWPSDCHRVKVRLNNCNEALHHNCFVGSICCGDGCNTINVFEKLPWKKVSTKLTGKRGALAEPDAKMAKGKPMNKGEMTCTNPNICYIRRTLSSLLGKRDAMADGGDDRYPSCGAPICFIRRTLSSLLRLGKRHPEPEPKQRDEDGKKITKAKAHAYKSDAEKQKEHEAKKQKMGAKKAQQDVEDQKKHEHGGHKRDGGDDRYPSCGAPICFVRRTLASMFGKRDAVAGGGDDRYPSCGAPICFVRRTLSSLLGKRDEKSDTVARPIKPSPKYSDRYPACGAPICFLRRALNIEG